MKDTDLLDHRRPGGLGFLVPGSGWTWKKRRGRHGNVRVLARDGKFLPLPETITVRKAATVLMTLALLLLMSAQLSAQVAVPFIRVSPPSSPGACSVPNGIASNADWVWFCVPQTNASGAPLVWKRIALQSISARAPVRVRGEQAAALPGMNPAQYTLAHRPAPGTLVFYCNGLRMTSGLDYVINGSMFTLTESDLTCEPATVDYEY